MPKIRYGTYKPRGEAARLIVICDQILREYTSQGFHLTVRQLYYQLVAQDLFPDSWKNEKGTKNHVGNYNRLGDILSKAREAGMIDWSHIQDRGRVVKIRPHWTDGRQFLSSVAPQFHIDLWADQKYRVECWVEKDALGDVIEQACYPYDVPNFACKGYTSVSAIWEAAHNRFLKQYAADKQKIIVIHLGDHDPSGVHMTADIEKRLELFSSPYSPGERRPQITVDRIALNIEQVREYNPPPNPTKDTDSRSPDYIARFGETCWELDALEPRLLTRLIRERIEHYLDRPKFDARVAFARQERHRLMAISRNWESTVEALPPGAVEAIAEEEEEARLRREEEAREEEELRRQKEDKAEWEELYRGDDEEGDDE